MQRTTIIALLSFMLIGCSADRDYLAYQASPNNSFEEKEVVLNPCTLTGPEASVVLVELVAAPGRVPLQCPDGKWPSHTEVVVERVLDIVGDAPAEFTVAFDIVGDPLLDAKKGDLFLLSMREVNGLWIAVERLEVSFEGSEEKAVAKTDRRVVDLPAATDELIAQTRAADADPNCGDRLYLQEIDDAELEQFLTNAQLCNDPNPMTDTGGSLPGGTNSDN